MEYEHLAVKLSVSKDLVDSRERQKHRFVMMSAKRNLGVGICLVLVLALVEAAKFTAQRSK